MYLFLTIFLNAHMINNKYEHNVIKMIFERKQKFKL